MNSDGQAGASLALTVINGGYCVGCGTCAAAAPDSYGMEIDERGQWQAVPLHDPTPAGELVAQQVCPFSSESWDETALARRYIADQAPHYDPVVGYYRDIWAGRATGDYPGIASSGGLATWLACALLERNDVDAVVHVSPIVRDGPEMFRYSISRTVDQVRGSAKSHYQSVEMSGVIAAMRASNDRYFVIGVPCFITAVRNLCRIDDEFAARVELVGGLFCGHMKSMNYHQLLALQAGIDPADVAAVDFRRKQPDKPANQYATGFRLTSGDAAAVSSSALPATDWGLGLLKFRACDFCDDITAETADVSFGDAWLRRYVQDPQGTSLVISRNALVSSLLRDGLGAGALELEQVSADDVIRSQDANFRHRRRDLPLRVRDARQAGAWVPRKRVQDSTEHLSSAEKERARLRVQISEGSHAAVAAALAAGDASLVNAALGPLIERYRALSPGKWRRRFDRVLAPVLRRGQAVRGYLSDSVTYRG